MKTIFLKNVVPGTTPEYTHDVMPLRRSFKRGRSTSYRKTFAFGRSQFGRRKFVRRARTHGGGFGGRRKGRKAFFSTRAGRSVSGTFRSRMRGLKMGFVSKGRYDGGSRVWAGANSHRFFKTRRIRGSTTAPHFDHPPRAYGGPKVPSRAVFPFDTYYSTVTSGPQYVGPSLAASFLFDGVMGGLDLGVINTNIVNEANFATVGGTFAYQSPTVYIDWECVIELCNMGTSDLYFEVVPYNRKQGAISSIATQGTAFVNAWPLSYDTRPTGFENFPQTSLLANTNWWRQIATPLRPRYIKVPTGKVVKLPYRSRKTKVIRRDDLPNNTTFYSTGGFMAWKTINFIIKATAQMGQACGVLAATNTPTATTVGGDFIINCRNTYRYRYRYENQMSSIYGTHLPNGYTVSAAAQSFIGVPAAKATRAVNNASVHNISTEFGGLDPSSKTEADINPVIDCLSDTLLPNTHAA